MKLLLRLRRKCPSRALPRSSKRPIQKIERKTLTEKDTEMRPVGLILPPSERHIRPLIDGLKNDSERVRVWQNVQADGKTITAELVQAKVNEFIASGEVVEEMEFTLIDGHNRLEICQRLGIPFATVPMEFDDRNQVKLWIIQNQEGRRNLTDAWKYRLAQTSKAILLKVGKAKQKEAGVKFGEKHSKQELLSTIDKS